MNRHLREWVDDVARLTKPDKIHWCDGGAEENAALVRGMIADGTLLELDGAAWPNCHLHRSHSSDVARTEHLTFICSAKEEDAGPSNNWMSPDDARKRLLPLFDGAMRGRTMYVVPYLLGPDASPFSKVGVELTDSPYVVASLRIMTRMGAIATRHLGDSADFVKGLHSLGDLSPERRFICHFPETREIWSVGSGYGGNALLSKKCHALRIASVQGRDEGWMAEHMLVLGIEEAKTRETTWVLAAFPSACGKTNLAMLVPPESQKDYRVKTLGDDIAWLRVGRDGRLWAINPEAGFFGVAPGTSRKTNPNALATISRNTIFTNVAMTAGRAPWWEGLDGPSPESLTDWAGKPWTKASGTKAAHPNSRFTAPASQCPSLAAEFEDRNGVPVSAIVFGGRRASVVPLVYQARDWEHGVYVGSSLASETTAAATGAVGVVRRDPMAMLPFCGYHMGDYFAHWLKMGKSIGKPPAIFHVNWFRQSAEGKFLWPGFGENLRVLRWILDRTKGRAAAVESPIGLLPAPGGIDTSGLDVSPETMAELLRVDVPLWKKEVAEQREFFSKLGKKLPEGLAAEMRALAERLDRAR